MQPKIAILSNAGGTGKSTTAVHLAYELAHDHRKSVALFDLDPQGSLNLFCGHQEPQPQQTISQVLENNDFTGDWPLVNCWPDHVGEGVVLCQGGARMEETSKQLVLHERGSYLLADRLEDYPLTEDIIIFDCPATLGSIALIALTACSHILINLQLEAKSIHGSGNFLNWFFLKRSALRLKPRPEILGIIPCQYDKSAAEHRANLQALPQMLAELDITLFKPIRHSRQFPKASAEGIPLHLFRPSHPAAKEDFREITKSVLALI